MTTKIRIFAIFASLIMLTVVAVPMIGAETDYEYCNNYNELEISDDIKIPTSPHREILDTPLHLIEICPKIERSVPHPHLIIASACDDRQKLIFEAIEKYSETSEKEQEYLKEFMKYIWEKYPVTYKIVDEFYLINEGIWQPFYEEEKYIDCDDVKSNYIVTLYQFDMDEIDAQNIKLTDAENEMLGKVFESLLTRAVSLTNAYNNVRDTGSDTEFGILWRGGNPPGDNIHQDMTRIAVSHWIISDWFIEAAASASIKPDNSSHGGWIDQNQVGQFRDDCWIERWVFDNFIRPVLFDGCERSALRKWTHAYINIGIMWIGGAPEEARRFGVRARSYVNTRQWINASRNIGYDSHFLTDVGQPMHTGGFRQRGGVRYITVPTTPPITLPVPIIPKTCIHTVQYYNFIRDNWERGRNFRRDVTRDNIAWWFTGANDHRNCPDFATKQLASYSNRYVNRLVDGILFAGSPGFPRDWQNCPEIIRISRNVLVRTMRWNRGLAWHALQDWLPR